MSSVAETDAEDAPDPAVVGALSRPSLTEESLVYLSPGNWTDPLVTTLPAAYAGAHLLLVMLKTIRLYLFSTAKSAPQLSLRTILEPVLRPAELRLLSGSKGPSASRPCFRARTMMRVA